MITSRRSARKASRTALGRGLVVHLAQILESHPRMANTEMASTHVDDTTERLAAPGRSAAGADPNRVGSNTAATPPPSERVRGQHRSSKKQNARRPLRARSLQRVHCTRARGVSPNAAAAQPRRRSG
jgi:hypothetical protein